MKFKKITEIIDSDNNLIGDDNMNGNRFEIGGNLSVKTTDDNIKISGQPFDYSTMGKYGFSLLPFYENDNSKSHDDFILELIELYKYLYTDILKYYLKNPNNIKNHYRLLPEDDSFIKKNSNKFLDKLIPILNNYLKKPDSLLSEDEIVDNKEYDLNDKSNDNEIIDANIKIIAGLINKLDLNDYNKLMKLIEIK